MGVILAEAQRSVNSYDALHFQFAIFHQIFICIRALHMSLNQMVIYNTCTIGFWPWLALFALIVIACVNFVQILAIAQSSVTRVEEKSV